jgi:circadian clock protein KaiC
VSSGAGPLDAMLGGGFYRGSSVLITGSAGTGKSILAGLFAEAACRRKERTLYVSFDENPSEVVRDLSSVGIRLAPHIKSGVLRMHSARAETFSAEVHLINIKRIVREHQPRCTVIDPLSAMVKAGGALSARRGAEGMIYLAKSEGITLLSTSLLQGAQSLLEETPVQISTIADTWIHLTNVSQAGERNRALSIVKSRGMKHSNQVREVILSDEGIALADVYTAAGDVLMGTARWQKEAAERTEQERILAEVEHKRREVALARAELTARIEALEQELKQKEADAERLIGADARHKLDLVHRRERPEQSPSAKIIRKRPENSRVAGKKMTRRRRSPNVFRLYVVNEGPGSARAIANLSAICKTHLPDNHQIEIVDLLQDPRRVLTDKIVATPTLIKLSPAPVQKIIGDLSEEAKVLLALGLQQGSK